MAMCAKRDLVILSPCFPAHWPSLSEQPCWSRLDPERGLGWWLALASGWWGVDDLSAVVSVELTDNLR